MFILRIKFKSALPFDDLMIKVNERIEDFRALPGLMQKYYFKTDTPNEYGGLYIWKDKESMIAYRESDLAKTIAGVYQVEDAPDIEVLESFMRLRE